MKSMTLYMLTLINNFKKDKKIFFKNQQIKDFLPPLFSLFFSFLFPFLSPFFPPFLPSAPWLMNLYHHHS